VGVGPSADLTVSSKCQIMHNAPNIVTGTHTNGRNGRSRAGQVRETWHRRYNYQCVSRHYDDQHHLGHVLTYNQAV
jgi:hypothetical protein